MAAPPIAASLKLGSGYRATGLQGYSGYSSGYEAGNFSERFRKQ
ncbi:hypothetical protein C4K19_2527 [Pseudomonas chlororaphis subsp. aurantiaca]|nr:hypothetical protein C4K19_2527 [Pseudomonas chlororaphis subsp. aurantiaca]